MSNNSKRQYKAPVVTDLGDLRALTANAKTSQGGGGGQGQGDN